MDTQSNKLSILGYQFFPTIGLKVTNKCNMHCSFCCEPARNNCEVETSIFFRIIDILAGYGTKRICFTGGEPLLYPNVVELLEYTKSKKMESILLTADGDLLSAVPIPKDSITSIRVSIHGLKAMHDNIVGKVGAFERLVSAIETLKVKNYPISIATVVTCHSFNKTHEIAEWCIQMGIQKLYLFNLLRSGLGDTYVSVNGRISDKLFIDTVKDMNEYYQNQNLTVIGHPYMTNAECILLYGNGDVFVDPYFDGENYQKKIGNLFEESATKIISNMASDISLWNDCLSRFSRSTLFMNK